MTFWSERTGLPKPIALKVLWTLMSAGIYKPIWSSLYNGKHVTHSESHGPGVYKVSLPKLPQPTPLLAVKAATFLQCNQQDNHTRKWLSHHQQCVQLNKKWQDHMKRSLQSKSERRLGNRQQMELVWYSCWLLEGLTDEHTAPNEYVRELISRKRALRKKYERWPFFWSCLAELLFLCQFARCHTARKQ